MVKMYSVLPIIKDTTIYIFSKLIVVLTNLVFLSFFTKLIGFSDYGMYNFFIYKINLIVSISMGWLSSSQLRYGVDKNVFRTPFYLFLFSTLLALIVVVIAPSKLENNINNYLITFFCVLSLGFFSFLRVVFQSSIFPIKVAKLNVLQSILFLILPFLFLSFAKSGYLNLAILTSLAFLFSSLSFFTLNSSLFDLRFKEFDWKIIKKWFFYGMPISIWGSISLLLQYLERFFINKYLDAESLGVFASISELSLKSFSLFLFPITLSIHPRIMNSWNKGDKEKALYFLKKGINLFSYFIVLFTFFLILFDDIIFNVIKLILPGLPPSSINLILPLFLTGALWQLALLLHKTIELNEKTHLMIYFIIVSLVINISGNSLLIEKYGMTATAYTSMISAACYCFLCFINYYNFKKS